MSTGYSRPLPSGMGVKHLSFASMKRFYSSQEGVTKLSNPLKPKEMPELIAVVMRAYNRQYREDHPDRLKQLRKAKIIPSVSKYEAYSKLSLPGGDQAWQPEEHNQFRIVAYKYTSFTLGSIASMLGDLGVEGADDAHARSHSFVFFLYRITKVATQVFALYTNEGHRPIQVYTDYTFPNKVALRLLAPIADRPHKEAHKQIIGSVVTADAIVRASEAYNPNQVGKVFTSYKAVLRDDASIRVCPVFLNKDKEPARVEFEIRQGVVKVGKSLSLNDFSIVLDLFTKILTGKATYCTEGGKATKRRERDDAEAFRIYKYYTLVPFGLKKPLNDALAKEIAENVASGQGQTNWELSPPKYRDFHGSRQFRLDITLPNMTSPVIIGPWEGTRPTYRELILRISHSMPRLPKKALEDQVPRWYFSFRGPQGGWEREKLVNSLTGMKFLNVGGHTGCYFHLHSQWYETTASLLEDVATQFRGLFSDALIEDKEPGYLFHAWEPSLKFWTIERTAEHLGVKVEDLRGACDQRFRWVEVDGIVRYEDLADEILSHPLISRFQSKIDELLRKDKITKEEVDAIAGIRYGQVIWEELTKERCLAEIFEVTVDKKKRELVRVLNTFDWPEEFKRQEKIDQLAIVSASTSDEGAYNERYLYDVTNIVKKKAKPYTLGGSGWLVGDRITKGWGIEIFDVLYFTEPKDNRVYLYHVKEGFNHVVRDACSQIVNSARTIFDARQRNSKAGKAAETVLSNFFDEATKEGQKSKYRKAVRKQMLVIGKKGFLNLFQGREIVFVYAFVDDRAEDYQIRREDLKKERFTEADFTSEKTAGIAKKILSDLKKGKYLGKKGGRGEKFPSLYKVENLTFRDSALSEHRKFVWDILTRPVGHYSSLIARMDLLQTRREVEGMGFGFKICQIKRPYNLKSSAAPPVSASWDGLEEDLSQSLQEDFLTEGLCFYFNMWTNESEAWHIQPTKGDGSCAFHALLGERVGAAKYACENVGQLRQAIVGEFREKLNPARTAFTDPGLQALYKQNVRLMAQEAVRPLDGLDPGSAEYVLRECARRIFADGAGDDFEEYKGKHGDFTEKVKEVLSDAKCKPTGGQMQAVKKKLGKKGSDFGKEEVYKMLPTRARDIFDAIASIKAEGTYKWMEVKVTSAKEAHDAVEPCMQSLVDSAQVMSNFLDCIADPSYWLSDDELQMVADVRGLRVEIVRKDPSSPEGDYGCNNHTTLLPPGCDPRSKVVVHGSDNHFSRCEPYGESE